MSEAWYVGAVDPEAVMVSSNRRRRLHGRVEMLSVGKMFCARLPVDWPIQSKTFDERKVWFTFLGHQVYAHLCSGMAQLTEDGLHHRVYLDIDGPLPPMEFDGCSLLDKVLKWEDLL